MMNHKYMAKVACPYCGSEAKVIHPGVGYIAVCCDRVVHVSDTMLSSPLRFT